MGSAVVRATRAEAMDKAPKIVVGVVSAHEYEGLKTGKGIPWDADFNDGPGAILVLKCALLRAAWVPFGRGQCRENLDTFAEQGRWRESLGFPVGRSRKHSQGTGTPSRSSAARRKP
jgi:hypothetical protein